VRKASVPRLKARRTKRAAPLPSPPETAAELAALWRLYGRRRSTRSRNRLVAYYLQAAHRVVAKILTRMPAQADRDNMRAAADLALIGLVEKYDPARGNQFETYMQARLRGAVLDTARQTDRTGGRVKRARIKGHVARLVALEHALGRRASTEEIENAAGRQPHVPSIMSLNQQIRRPAADQDAVSRPPILADVICETPKKRLNDPFWKAILHCLNCNEFMAVALYYRYGHRMRHIGEILGLSETRISQTISNALDEVRRTARNPAVLEGIREYFGSRNGAILADS